MNEGQAEEHHRGDEERVADEKRDDEDADGVRRADAIREPLGRSLRLGLEHGWPRLLVLDGGVETERPGVDGRPGLGLDVHVPAFTRRLRG